MHTAVIKMNTICYLECIYKTKRKHSMCSLFALFFPLCWIEMASKFLGDNEFMTKIFHLNKYDKNLRKLIKYSCQPVCFPSKSTKSRQKSSQMDVIE